MRPQPGQLGAAEAQLPGVGPHESAQHVEQGGLARTVRPDDPGDLPRRGVSDTASSAVSPPNRTVTSLISSTPARSPGAFAGAIRLLNLGSDIRLEEVAVRAGTHLDSLTITEARARYAGVAILALKKPGSEVLANPDHQVRLAPGDLIVALGPAEILNRMAS